jgi:GNAT superfamily N-acetyltransferase
MSETMSTLFASMSLVRRIEVAEARALEAVVSVGGPNTWAMPAGGGVALFRAQGSPFNKVIGLGFSPLEEAQLERIEHGYQQRGAPVQIELATHADPAVTNLLAARGYHLTGFESVLGRALDETAAVPTPASITVRRASDPERQQWVDVLMDGAAEVTAGETSPAHDEFERAVLELAFKDMADNRSIARWIALMDDQVVGGASMGICDGIAQLLGAATRPSARRRGVQSALLAARLTAAHASGCDLAVVTTQPGTKSQQNVQRAGFTPLYARAIWLRERA